jgi:hypothetical protein
MTTPPGIGRLPVRFPKQRIVLCEPKVGGSEKRDPPF